MNIIIPLRGVGKRFSDVGYTKHKSLLEINHKRVIDYVLENLHLEDQVCRVYIVTRLDLGDLPDYVTIVHASQPTSGAAETVGLAEEFLDDPIDRPCCVMDGDTFYGGVDILSRIKAVDGAVDGAVVCFRPEPRLGCYSYIATRPREVTATATRPREVNEASAGVTATATASAGVSAQTNNGKITEIREKDPFTSLANTGVYYFSSTQTMLRYIRSTRPTHPGTEYYMSCVIQKMLSDGLNFVPVEIEASQFTVLGTPSHVTDYVITEVWPDKVWLFDLDGTLVHTDHIYKRVWRQILYDFNVHLTDDIYDTYIRGKDDSTVVETLLKNEDPRRLGHRKDTLFREHALTDVVPGGVELIHRLIELKRPVCIVTNCNRATAEWILKQLGLSEVPLIIGNECERPKPYPHPYTQALVKLGATGDRAIVFEDSNSGILSARSAGIGLIVGISESVRGADVVMKDFRTLSEATNYTRNGSGLVKNIARAYTCETGICVSPKDIHIDVSKLKGGYIADVMRVQIGSGGAVVKMENPVQSGLRTVALELDLYNREYYFYSDISKLLQGIVRVPRCYGIVRGEDFKPTGIILEDLATPEYIIGLDLNTQSIEVSLRIVKRMAELHAAFRNRTDAFAGLKRSTDPQFSGWAEFVRSKYPEFRARWAGVLTESQLVMGQMIVDRFKDIQRELSMGELTLCHGDIKAGNIFFKTDSTPPEPVFIDWQYIAAGKGVQDLVFLLIESYTPEKCKELFGLLTGYYVQVTKELGSDVCMTTFKRDLHNAMCYYPFFVAVWFGTTPPEDLIDVNFPFFYIFRLFQFYETVQTSNI